MPKPSRSRKSDKKKLLISEDRLRALIEKILAEDPANADLMVVVFCKMIAGINQGPDGVEKTRSALKLCLDSISPHLGTGRLKAGHLLQHLDDLLSQAGVPEGSVAEVLQAAADEEDWDADLTDEPDFHGSNGSN
ncbi:MAG TPA: hypothetical protein VI756_13830 [Blastocatellia bacterium]